MDWAIFVCRERCGRDCAILGSGAGMRVGMGGPLGSVARGFYVVSGFGGVDRNGTI